MSTPTPDPPPAAPLTAEQIAAIALKAAVAYDLYIAHGAVVSSTWDVLANDIPSLIASHAALRDRLARAEERCVALEGVLEDAHSTLYGLAQMAHNWTGMGTAEQYEALINANVVRASRMRKRIHALLATPTDGAARAGDAAGDRE